jgi:hypothetical protein
MIINFLSRREGENEKEIQPHGNHKICFNLGKLYFISLPLLISISSAAAGAREREKKREREKTVRANC